MNRPIA